MRSGAAPDTVRYEKIRSAALEIRETSALQRNALLIPMRLVSATQLDLLIALRGRHIMAVIAHVQLDIGGLHVQFEIQPDRFIDIESIVVVNIEMELVRGNAVPPFKGNVLAGTSHCRDLADLVVSPFEGLNSVGTLAMGIRI